MLASLKTVFGTDNMNIGIVNPASDSEYKSLIVLKRKDISNYLGGLQIVTHSTNFIHDGCLRLPKGAEGYDNLDPVWITNTKIVSWSTPPTQ
ncbi:MAG: hypothetical protein LBB07_01790 [Bifidobacteriaceae bacterium]|jgi:hypothetical protein|nr:hypothetical protein [Bifidobacteriaceae bacterium]